jgi:hypothetical protein
MIMVFVWPNFLGIFLDTIGKMSSYGFLGSSIARVVGANSAVSGARTAKTVRKA